MVLGHGVVDGKPSPRSTGGLENRLVLVPLVGCVKSPEDDGLASPLSRVRGAGPKLLVHGNLADQVAAGKLTLSPRSGIAFILRALALVASSLILLALTTLASLLATAVLDIRVLNSHAQDTSPFHSREGNMDLLTGAGVAITVSLGVAASVAVNTSLVGVDATRSVVVVELSRAGHASDTLPTVVLESGVGNGDFDEAGKLGAGGELGMFVQVKSSAHLKQKALFITSRNIERLVESRGLLLPTAGDRLDTCRCDTVDDSSILVEEHVLSEQSRVVIRVGVFVEMGERGTINGDVVGVIGDSIAHLDIRRRHKDVASLRAHCDV